MRYNWSKSLAVATLIVSCQKNRVKEPAQIPQPPALTEEEILQVRRDKAKTFISQSPGLLDAEMDQRCEAISIHNIQIAVHRSLQAGMDGPPGK